MSATPRAEPRIGTAGWSIPRQHAAAFPVAGSHLERYAQRFNAVEINSSFYRPHRRATYQRWAASVPVDFAFAVKVPRVITHDLRLAGARAPLDIFLDQVSGLGSKLRVLLFQFPPSFAFNARTFGAFFGALRRRHDGDIACEPRHASWFVERAEALLRKHGISRVASDPAVVPAAAQPGGATTLRYFRLHGAPRMYRSNYEPDRIAHYAGRLTPPAWCIFDNTTEGAATGNALALAAIMRGS
jgi:uncharacterized protein YecE (DUF72 family)